MKIEENEILTYLELLSPQWRPMASHVVKHISQILTLS